MTSGLDDACTAISRVRSHSLTPKYIVNAPWNDWSYFHYLKYTVENSDYSVNMFILYNLNTICKQYAKALG
jgi:hypothetical protein